MTEKQISLTVPADPVVAGLAAEFFDGIARHLRAGTCCKECGCTPDQPAALHAVAPPPPAEKTEAEIAFDTQEVPPTQPLPEGMDVAPPPPVVTAEDTIGVDLAGDPAIPWDSRIHGAAKAKLSKAPQGWKLKRQPKEMDKAQWDEFVKSVEAELLVAMGASPSKPITTDVAPPPPAAGGVITQPFPLFMQKVTAAGLAPEVVLAAVNKVGVPSTVLLATRPDLIPAVEAELFPEA